MGHRAWYEGDQDPVSGHGEVDSRSGQVVRNTIRSNTVDVGKNNEFEPDQASNPRSSSSEGPLSARKVIERTVEFAAHDPVEIMQECEEQDEMLGLPQGTTLQLFLDSINHTH